MQHCSRKFATLLASELRFERRPAYQREQQVSRSICRTAIPASALHNLPHPPPHPPPHPLRLTSTAPAFPLLSAMAAAAAEPPERLCEQAEEALLLSDFEGAEAAAQRCLSLRALDAGLQERCLIVAIQALFETRR